MVARFNPFEMRPGEMPRRYDGAEVGTDVDGATLVRAGVRHSGDKLVWERLFERDGAVDVECVPLTGTASDNWG